MACPAKSYKTNRGETRRMQEHLRKGTRTYKNTDVQKLYVVTNLKYFTLVHRIKVVIASGIIS